MRLTTVILLASLLQVSAATFGQRITMNQKNIPMESVLKEIRKQSGYDIYYDSNVIPKDQQVNVNLNNATLEEALTSALKGLKLSYKIDGNIVSIRALEKPSFLEDFMANFDNISVYGRVLDENGNSLYKATIRVKDQETTVQSDSAGRFFIKSIDSKSIIQISYIGYKTLELVVKANMGEMKMEILSGELSEVTVSTGYQKISKERFVGSAAILDSAAFARRAGMGIVERLDGTVTGVLFNKKGISFPLQVRGISTLGYNQTPTGPLIVLDNFPLDEQFDINSINPNDVENITVLRDAAASSIWGTRAGNGVIVITTKKGKIGQPLNIAFNSNISINEKPNLNYFPAVNPSDFIDVEQMLFEKKYYDRNINNKTRRPVLTPVVEILARTRNGLPLAEAQKQIDSYRNNNLTDNLNRYMYREPIRQQHNISLTGGASNLAYNLSVGYNKWQNNIIGSRPDGQITINSNTTYRLNRSIEFQAGINYTVDKKESYSTNMPSIAPYLQIADNEGNALAVPNTYRPSYIDTVGTGILLDWHYRPVDEITATDYLATNKFLRLNFSTSVTITPGLVANVSYQFAGTNSLGRKNNTLQSFYTRNLINRFTNPSKTGYLRNPVPIGDILELSNGEVRNNNVRTSFTYNKNWDNAHVITGFIGAELSSIEGQSDFQTLYGFNDDVASSYPYVDFQNYYATVYASPVGGVDVIPAGNGYQESIVNRNISLFVNGSYTYKGRYTLYASARRDGANVFGVNTNNRWKPLWSAGASWDISKEPFFNSSLFSSLRLRGSYGYTGNVNNRLSGVFSINYSGFTDFLSGLPTANANTPSNPNLRWEQVNITNLGLDFSMIKSRLGGTFEIFQKKSSDVIVLTPFPSVSGVQDYPVNSANLRTRGFDLNFNSLNLNKIFRWSSNLGVSYAKSIVTKLDRFLPVTTSDFIDYQLNAVPGQIAFGIAGYRWAGLDPLNGDPQGIKNGEISKDYQDILYDDVQNQVFKGSAIPLYSTFLRNDFSFKGFSLSVNLTARFKYYFREPTVNLDYTSAVLTNFLSSDYYQRWQKSGDEKNTDIPSISYPTTSNTAVRNQFYRFSEILIKRADNVKIQDIRFAYDVNLQKRKYAIQSLQFFIYANNLNMILWRADNTKYDPDFVTGGGRGVDAGPLRSLTAGLNIKL